MFKVQSVLFVIFYWEINSSWFIISNSVKEEKDGYKPVMSNVFDSMEGERQPSAEGMYLKFGIYITPKISGEISEHVALILISNV